MGHLPPEVEAEMATILFDAIDEDGDGMISREDFEQFFARRPTPEDTPGMRGGDRPPPPDHPRSSAEESAPEEE